MVAPMVAPPIDSRCESVRMSENGDGSRRDAEPLPERDQKPLEMQRFEHNCESLTTDEKAERQGFEPWVPLRAHWFSRPAQSATLSPLRGTRRRADHTLERESLPDLRRAGISGAGFHVEFRPPGTAGAEAIAARRTTGFATTRLGRVVGKPENAESSPDPASTRVIERRSRPIASCHNSSPRWI